MKLTYNDQKHAYWLDGKRCKGITSVAKYPDDTYGLDQWRSRQIVIGLACTPALVHRAAAHFDERDKIQDIAEEALVAAKAHEASGRGTADHRITERIDLGLDWIDTPEARAIHAAWTSALDHAGLEIVPDYVERIVVYPDKLIAGRFDRIARYRASERLVVVDVKTGENAIRYPHSTSVQLGLYANAPLMAGPLRRGQNGSEWTDQFEPLPDGLHRDHAIVVYLPPEGPAACHRMDIARGWQAATAICFPTIAWRKTDKADLVRPLDPALPVAADPERVAWVRARVQTIVEAGHEDELAGIWDVSKVPAPLGPTTVLTDPQVNQLVGWCSGIEALAGLAFEPTDPLYKPFTPAPAADPPPPIEPDTSVDEEALQWADKARGLLDEFDADQQAAIVAACEMTGHETMTEELYDRIAAVASQVADPGGAVILTYTEDGRAAIGATPNAAELMEQAAGGRGAARDIAAALRRQQGHIAPRGLDQAAQIPLLAALVAAGHQPTPKEQQHQ